MCAWTIGAWDLCSLDFALKLSQQSAVIQQNPAGGPFNRVVTIFQGASGERSITVRLKKRE
jgi:hypothetical protein